GWLTLGRRLPERFGSGRLFAFAAGLACLLLAGSESLEALAQRRLSAHMIQHMLLLMGAPALLGMGGPVAPLLLRLAQSVGQLVAGGLAWWPVRRLSRVLADPRLGLGAFLVAFWMWHVPGPYDLALRSHFWHHVEHACFFTTAMLFWRPVILAWPARSTWPR